MRSITGEREPVIIDRTSELRIRPVLMEIIHDPRLTPGHWSDLYKKIKALNRARPVGLRPQPGDGFTPGTVSILHGYGDL